MELILCHDLKSIVAFCPCALAVGRGTILVSEAPKQRGMCSVMCIRTGLCPWAAGEAVELSVLARKPRQGR